MPSSRPAPVDRIIAWLPIAFVLAISLVGGASRADALGQVFVRLGCVVAACLILLLRRPINLRPYAPVVVLLILAAATVAVQLVPLPPGLWSALPGRDRFGELAGLIGASDVWRPMAIVPDAALNALFSLCVPAVLLMAFGIADADAPGRTLRWLILVVGFSALIALLQTAGGAFDNPFVNQTPGEAAGLLANRNHQALLMAIGIVIVPAWIMTRRRPPVWQWAVAFGAIAWFVLMVLATGSRAGLGLMAVALFLSAAANRQVFAPAWQRLSPRIRIGMVFALVGMLLALVLLSIRADTAKSFDRLFALDASEDMRARAIPTILDMIRSYFPVGSGAGSFDPVFRISEPLAFLHQSYFNHAHNDYLEIVLTNGLPGVLLIVAALGWWLRTSIAVWRPVAGSRTVDTGTGRLGSAVLLLILIASVTDYPARTPLIMAIAISAACAMIAPGRSALPQGRNAI